MVKDYKRLHHLDFAQPDLDDSDGGYSDYRISDVHEESTSESLMEEARPKDVIPTSPFHCGSCKREYTTPHRYPISFVYFFQKFSSLFFFIFFFFFHFFSLFSLFFFHLLNFNI